MTAKIKKEGKKRNSADRPAGGTSVGGTYVYDKEQGKLVKVSDRVPKVASKRGASSASGMACGGGACDDGGGCGGGACGMS